MCEYCEKFADNQFKLVANNRPIDASLFIDGKRSRLFWRVNHVHGGTLLAYAEINYCPMCNRNLREATDDDTDKIVEG